MKKYTIYQKQKRKRTTIGYILRTLLIVVIVSIVSLLIIATFPPLFRYKDIILEQTFTLNMIFIGLIVCSVLYYVLVRGKKALKPIGELYFGEEYISICGKKIHYGEINRIRVIGNDIRGEFRGQNSDGKGNLLIISLKEGETIEYHLEQTIDNRLRDDSQLEELYIKNIMSKSNYESILKNTNYY